MKIYTKTGIERYDAPVTKDAIHAHELMKEHYVQLSFNAPLISFAKGDYLEHEGVRFYLFTIPTPERNGSFWKYTVKFESFEANFKNRIFFFIPKMGANESEWSLTSSPATFIEMILKNINAFLDTTITAGSIIAGDVQSLSFSNVSVWDALTQIAEIWDTEWWYNDGVLNLCKCEVGTAVAMSSTDHLITGAKGDETGYATRIYAYGSTRNIIPETISSATTSILNNRLHLAGADYIDAKTGLSKEEVVEAVALFDHIYPRFKDHEITSLRSEKQTLGGAEQDVFFFKDSKLTEDPELIPGLDLSVKFESGNLNGREFELSYNSTTKEFEVINQSDGIIIPNASLCPKVGDKIVLFNLVMPRSLIMEAQEELRQETLAYIAQTSRDRTVYNVKTDAVLCAKNEQDYIVGQLVCLTGEEFGVGRESRIRRFEKAIYNKYICSYQVGDNAKYSRFDKIESDTKEVKYAYQSASNEGGSIRLITRYDKTNPSDLNTYSALRSKREFLSKSGDLATGLIKLLEGAEFGDFVKSMSAGKGAGIDDQGNAQLESLEVRSSIKILEMIYNRLNAIEGETSFTEFGTIDNLELQADGSYLLTIRKRWDFDFTAFQEHDVIYGIVNNLASEGVYYTSWMRVLSKNTTANTLSVALYPDSEVPAGVNYPPSVGMNLTRRGNSRIPGEGEHNKRQDSWYMSTAEGAIKFLQGVDSPIIHPDSIALVLGLLPKLEKFKDLPINYNQPYLYARGAVIQDLMLLDYNGSPIKTVRNRGVWQANPEEKYRRTTTMVDEAYHLGCKWQVVVDETADVPSYASPGWLMVEGNPLFTVDIESSRGFMFDYENFATTLSVVGSLHNQDVTESLLDADIAWTRDTGDPAEDNAWAIKRADAGKQLPLTRDDLGTGYLEVLECRFTVTATLRDGNELRTNQATLII